jgi:hypothetical protein
MGQLSQMGRGEDRRPPLRRTRNVAATADRLWMAAGATVERWAVMTL